MKVTVYERPGCGPCVATKRALTNARIPFDSIDTSTDQEARDYLVYRGFTQSPVVIAEYGGQEHAWTGHRMTAITALIAHRDHNNKETT